MRKTLFVDCETTGIDPARHGIVQMAMLMDIDGYVEDKLMVKCQPFYYDEFILSDGTSPQYCSLVFSDQLETAQTPTGIKLSEIITYQKPQEAFAQVLAFLDKHISKFDKADKAYFGAYNAKFDLDFLSAFFKKNVNNFLGSYLNYHFCDPLPILHMREWCLLAGYPLENYKLSTVCKAFDIPLIEHDPLSDIEACREVWYHLVGATNIKACCVCGKRGDRRGPDRVNWFCQNHYETDVEGRQ